MPRYRPFGPWVWYKLFTADIIGNLPGWENYIKEYKIPFKCTINDI